MAHARDPKGFAYLKRDLVRLLGILAADRPAVQDRVRTCGGIPVVLNLCVIDDRNPCEYATPHSDRASGPVPRVDSTRRLSASLRFSGLLSNFL